MDHAPFSAPVVGDSRRGYSHTPAQHRQHSRLGRCQGRVFSFVVAVGTLYPRVSPVTVRTVVDRCSHALVSLCIICHHGITRDAFTSTVSNRDAVLFVDSTKTVTLCTLVWVSSVMAGRSAVLSVVFYDRPPSTSPNIVKRSKRSVHVAGHLRTHAGHVNLSLVRVAVQASDLCGLMVITAASQTSTHSEGGRV